ncbi:MAG: DUF4080 domain-containing protein, partial [Oscillospiraceae bacterium]
GTVNESREAVLQRVAALAPEVVGLSCYIWNRKAVGELLPMLRQALPRAVLILGGPEVSGGGEALLFAYPQADYVISGEGEKSFALLLDAVAKGERAVSIPGVLGREGAALPCEVPETRDETVYTEEFIQALHGRIAYLETSRGCPFSCAFCLSGGQGAPRYFPLEPVKAELLLLANSGTQTVKLVDRTFNANERRAAEIVDFIAAHYGREIPAGVCFHFEIAGDILTRRLIGSFAALPPGAVQLEIGLQSFHEPSLAAVNRKTNTEKLTANIKKLVALQNMHIHVDLIAGLPLEDLPLFQESFAAAFALRPQMLQLGFLKILRGSPMGDHPEQFPCTHQQEPPYEITSTPWLSPEDLGELHLVEDALERLYNSGRFKKTLEFLLRETGVPAYTLFRDFSRLTGNTVGMGLDRYTELVWQHFSPQVNPDALRDSLVIDRLSTNSGGKLPQVLRGEGERMGELLVLLDREPNRRRTPGVKRASARLRTTGEIIYVDYLEKNPVTGAYPCHFVKIEEEYS